MGQIATSLREILTEDYLSKFSPRKSTQFGGGYVLFPNQIKCAIDILQVFDDNPPYAIVKAPTQSGKTGVCAALLNILSKEELWVRYQIKQVIYLTGDNSVELLKQTINRLDIQVFGLQVEGDEYYIQYKNNPKIKLGFIKQSDITRNKHRIDSLKNTLILLDESHYGTSQEKNKVIEFLTKNGLGMHTPSKFAELHSFMVSISATPYDEIYSGITTLGDEKWGKNIIPLSVTEEYIGIWNLEEKNIVKLTSKITIEDVDDIFNNAIIPHINNIGRNRSIIWRTRIPKDELYTKLPKEMFNITSFDMSQGKIDYDGLYTNIINHNEKVFNGTTDKFNLIIIKNAFRMGVSIDNKAKPLIGAIIDYSESKEETTEQGLVGRMCGYWSSKTMGDLCENWKSCLFVLNGENIESLQKYYKTCHLFFIKGDKTSLVSILKMQIELQTIPHKSKYKYVWTTDVNEDNWEWKGYKLNSFSQKHTYIREELKTKLGLHEHCIAWLSEKGDQHMQKNIGPTIFKSLYPNNEKIKYIFGRKWVPNQSRSFFNSLINPTNGVFEPTRHNGKDCDPINWDEDKYYCAIFVDMIDENTFDVYANIYKKTRMSWVSKCTFNERKIKSTYC